MRRWALAAAVAAVFTLGLLTASGSSSPPCWAHHGTCPSTTTTTSSTTTAPPPPVAPTLTGRWYSAASAFNEPIPDGIPSQADSATMIAALVNYHPSSNWLGLSSSGTPGDAYAPTGTPNVTLQLNYPSCDVQEFQIPIPSGTATEPAPGEATLVVVGADGTEWDLFKVTPPHVTPLSSGVQCSASAKWAATAVAVRGSTAGWQGDGTGPPSVSGARTALGTGQVRLRDLQVPNGQPWDHAVAFAYHYTASSAGPHPAFVYPASASDGTTSGTGAIPMGARLQLDPTIDCATWPSMAGQPDWKVSLCRTLQKYGAVISDTGDGFKTEWYEDTGTDRFTGVNGFSWGSPYLPNDLLSHFRVLDWVSWTH